ncbi:MAG: DUF354 domain-containing protein [Congregibacter sp.]
MKVLIDIVHPADVLFFLHPIRMLQEQGDQVVIAAREKDVTLGLLESFGLPYRIASRARPGLVRLGIELLVRDAAVLRCVREFRPDVMCGFGGVAIAHVGRLMGVPAISFYDTERASLQQRLTLPFISHIYVPEAFDGPTASGRTSRFLGTKELSYFHPENFRADRERALTAGLDPEQPNYFLRLVAWGANHDVGHRGLAVDTVSQIVSRLSHRGRLHVSSEAPLPDVLRPYAYAGLPTDVHHLIAHCDLYVGESATMAAEAVLLGVPAVYAVDDFRGYIRSLAADGLVNAVQDDRAEAALDAVDAGLRVNRRDWQERQQRWLMAQPNLARFVAEAISRHGNARPPASAPS